MDWLQSLEATTNEITNHSDTPKNELDIGNQNAFKEIEGSQIPKTLLILDTETTGLDPENDHCLEVGSILFHVESRSVLAQQSFLIPVESNQAEFINHIPPEITQLNQPWKEALVFFKTLLNAADVLLAHNAEFDRKWFGKPPLPEIKKPWICSMQDILWPQERQLSNRPSVRDLALAYGVPVWNAHRALTDCIYLSEVLQRCKNLEELLLRGLEPRRLMRAEVSYEERHLAKKAGFRWNDPVKGAWTRRLSDREIQDLEFTVVSVNLNG
tara:strand:- start:3449 stop:4258 length:810 start_codon:yes stop_codon:yes gene_type:complete